MNKIKQLCACGCGQVTCPGNRWVRGHNRREVKLSEKHKRNVSLAMKGNTNALGYKQTKEHKAKNSLAHFKLHPGDEYCEAWRDGEYKKDLIKDYCENLECKEHYKRLNNHHINLNKKDCRPCNIMTLCVPCHRKLHLWLGLNTNYKEYLTVIRKDHITYVHKATKRRITIGLRKA